MDSGVSFSELLEFTAAENRGWKKWFGEHPQALGLPCDIAGGFTVRTLLGHIFGVDLRYSHLLLALDLPDFKSLPQGTVDELFAVGEQADKKLREFIARSSSKDWDEIVPLGFLDLKASKRKIMAQVALHGVHHRAQLAHSSGSRATSRTGCTTSCSAASSLRWFGSNLQLQPLQILAERPAQIVPLQRELHRGLQEAKFVAGVMAAAFVNIRVHLLALQQRAQAIGKL